MIRTNWSGVSGRRLDFSRFAKMEYLIAGILGVIIIVAAVLAVRSLISNPDNVITFDKFYYKCSKCNAEFTKKPEEFPPERTPSDGMKKLLVDCPKCGAQASAWRLTQCPNPKCGKTYLSDLTKARWQAMSRGVGEPVGIQEKCPSCGTVVSEWYAKHPPQ